MSVHQVLILSVFLFSYNKEVPLHCCIDLDREYLFSSFLNEKLNEYINT